VLAPFVLDVSGQFHGLIRIDRRCLVEPVQIVGRNAVVAVVSLADCGIRLRDGSGYPAARRQLPDSDSDADES